MRQLNQKRTNEGKNKSIKMSSQQKNVANHHRMVQPSFVDPMYTKCINKFARGANGAQILMNSQSIVTATAMEFLEPTRTKVALCEKLVIPPQFTEIKTNASYSQMVTLSSTSMNYSTVSRTIWPTITKSVTILSTPYATTAPMSKLLIEQQQTTKAFLDSQTFAPEQHNQCKMCSSTGSISGSGGGDGGNGMAGTIEGNTIVNKIKSVFSYLMKPIIDTTNMIVGHDNDNHTTSSAAQMSASSKQQMQWSDANGSPVNHQQNHKSPSIYYDNNHSNDSFSYSDKSNYNHRHETFFDCDDYVDGGEDTIDFVAASTKIPYNSYEHEFCDLPIQEEASPKDSNTFYDCYTKFGTDTMSASDTSETNVDLTNSPTNETNEQPNTKSQSKSVQYTKKCDNKQKQQQPIMNCPKYEKPNQHSYRRKRKAKRKNKSANRQPKNYSGPNKNRHEKIRHEVEMNIHEDIDDCSIVKDGTISASYDDEPEFDLEIIDVDEYQRPPKNSELNKSTGCGSITSGRSPPAAKHTSIETPIPSPEMTSDCIFTRFFRFDGCKSKSRSLPLCLQQKRVPPNKPIKERSMPCRRASETESDDSFIVFEDSSPRSTVSVDDLSPRIAALKDSYKRQRQLSECSDDFILFEDDNADNYGNCSYRFDCTTDEDFTDSTDDTDDTDDGKLLIFFIRLCHCFALLVLL